MFKTYITNSYFDKSTYIDCLARMGITARIVENGVEINIDEYQEKFDILKAPHFVYLNHEWVKALY